MSDPAERDVSNGKHIVVGLDGSEGSRAALEFAEDEAAFRGMTVRAVMVFEPPDLWVIPAGWTTNIQELRQATQERATEQVQAVNDARTKRGAAVPPVEVEVDSGPASPVLERLSRDAALLVVGHRGRGEVASRLIGSVGLNCVVHAHCSVVVVHT